MNQHIFAKLPYDPFKDFAPITLLATVENVLVVNADVPAKTVQELVALARAKPGTLTFASPGSGSQAHLAGELLKSMTGIDIVHVAYKGTGPALNDLMGGQVTMMFSQMSSALPHVKSGKLRALGRREPAALRRRAGGADRRRAGARRVRGGVVVRAHRAVGHASRNHRQAAEGSGASSCNSPTSRRSSRGSGRSRSATHPPSWQHGCGPSRRGGRRS